MLDEHIQSFPNKVNKTQHSVTVDTGLAGCRNSHPTLSAYMKSLGKSVSHTVLWHLRRAGVTTHDFFTHTAKNLVAYATSWLLTLSPVKTLFSREIFVTSVGNL